MTSGLTFNKFVDYCFLFEPTKTLLALYNKLEGIVIKKTRSATLHFMETASMSTQSIAISIETKSEHSNNATNTQLLVWAAAHFQFLLELAELACISKYQLDIPVLPLLMIRGRHWYLHIAQLCPNQSGWEIQVHNLPGLYAVDSASGILRGTAIIPSLLHYAQRVYRPWLEDLAMRIIEAQ